MPLKRGPATASPSRLRCLFVAVVAGTLATSGSARGACPLLFETDTIHDRVAAVHPAWTAAVDRAHGELAYPTPALRSWLDYLNALQSLSARTKIESVNRYVNRAEYVCDRDALGNPNDTWRTPAELFEFGGDCEDFAFAKYLSLRYLGFAADDLRIVFAVDAISRTNHAFLVACTDEGQFVLDNQFATYLSLGTLAGYYVPLYALNEANWWTFPPP